MPETSYTFLLIHGSWMDGHAWQGVARHLRSLGHKVHAPTLKGHGNVADRRFSHQETWEAVVDYILEQELSDFILVGHSFGGTIISKIAETIPGRIRRLVYWNAFVLLDGECLAENTPPILQGVMHDLMQKSADQAIILPFPIFRESFTNDADFDLSKQIYEGLYPEYCPLFFEKLHFPTLFGLPIPKSYLYSWDDCALPHGEWGWYPKFAQRLGLFRLVTMPGSHMALMTAPVALANKIIEAGRD